MEIYVHIPFCVKKCNYCDFLSAPADENTKSAYVEALIKEIRLRADLFEVKEKVTSIYFGGGTPSTLNEKQIDNIISTLREEFSIEKDAEITIEINPKTADRDKLHFLKSFGFNRLSIGMQSTYEDELKMLGRIHTYDDFTEVYIDARDAGFTNINVDVMTALPGQDAKKLEYTVKRVIGLNPEHISAYSLIIEPGTPFYERYGSIEGPVVGEELERKLYWNTVKQLTEEGYCHYEISNFSKKGYESRHNTGYWKRDMYLGVGLGASSCLETGKYHVSESTCESNSGSLINTGSRQVRTRNLTDLIKYIDNPMGYSEYSELTEQDKVEETMFLGLRMMEGVSLCAFREAFGCDVTTVYADAIDKLAGQGLIERDDSRVKLSAKGIDYGNYVFSQFLL